MGFFKQLGTILPANGVKTRFRDAFQNAQGELYERLVFAWEKTFESYANRPEGIHNEDRIQTGILLCRFFATLENPRTASEGAAICSACLSYPAFGNVPENSLYFQFLLKSWCQIHDGDAHLLEEKFVIINPNAASQITAIEGAVFPPEAANFLRAFLNACGPK